VLKISVVIPTFNRLDTLQRVIPSLLHQDLSADQFELVVGDSQSNDGTAEYLARFPGRVRHIAGAFGGRAEARNAALAAARNEIVVFNDADIIASRDLLRRHLERHEGMERIAVVGQEVQVRSLAEYDDKRLHPERRNPLHKPSRKRLPWLYFLTGNASVRRRDVLAVGGFDETFTGYGHEDLELGYRLSRAGIAIYYEPRAVSYHLQDIPHEDQKAKMELAGRSTVRFFRKHPHFSVRANLGMTPVSLGLHSVLSKAPSILGHLDKLAARSRFARAVVQQYHYVSGIKSALRQDNAQRPREQGGP